MSYDYDEQKAQEMAEKYGKEASEEDVENVQANMSKMNRGPLAKIWDKVTTLWDAFKSPNTPASLKAMIIGGLIYMVSPIDLIPDFIPIFGLTDDVGVIGLVFSQFMRLTANATIGAAVVASIIKLYHLGVAEIQKELLRKKLRYGIIKNLKQGEDKWYAKVGLYDSEDNEVCEESFESDEIDDDIYEGMEIYA